MGVPKFYRWISERYPCLSQIVKENQIPEFDNLYLDMNGIIHTCSHPNDDDPHFRITEQEIFRDIFRYLEVLFRIIRPRKVFFMAVDGVAPRAKMNQQRGRRFMSARTAQDLIEKAKSKGEKLPSEERFDSNCITPGTAFMAKLHEQLKYFVNMKITTDEMWQGIRIYLSGHDVPGEGEHKIMDFIRHERSQPEYDHNTRHCLYGLDADLIMLGMCSHEPYFCLLREEVKFVRPSKKNSMRTANAEQTTFHLLHLSLLRDYIELEFACIKENLPFDFNLENIIDDWVLMGFLVGNDFIPHLPNLHIHSNALPALYKAYKSVLFELGGYINEGGFLNLPRFEKFLSKLSFFDRDFFQDEYADLQWLESKRVGGAHFPSRDIRKNVPRFLDRANPLVPYVDSDPEVLPEEILITNLAVTAASDDATSSEASSDNKVDTSPDQPADSPTADDEDEDISQMPPELQDLIRRSNAGIKNSDTNGDDEDGCNVKGEGSYEMPSMNIDTEDESESWSPDLEKKFTEFKSDYYKNKMSYHRVTAEVLHDQAVQYVRAIQWNLHYYYNGVCSWSWYYPHHYAPYLSDVKGFSDLDITFELGDPFLPFQQLLAVLPAASKKLLPSAYQVLMTDAESPLIDFYPSEFETDLNGKKNDWEAVILIPFIQENRLLQAMRPMDTLLTDEEKARNMPGKHLLYTTAARDEGFYRSSLVGVFPDLEHNKTTCKELDRDAFRLTPSQIRKGLLPGVQLSKYIFGFSTMKHLSYTGELTNHGVLVFQQNSKNESILIRLSDDSRCSEALADLAGRILGKEVYINWPHLTVGLIGGVATSKELYNKENGCCNIKRTNQNSKEQRTWEEAAEGIHTTYSQRRAVEIGQIDVLVYVYPLLGRRYSCNQRGDVSFEKQWGEFSIPCALQTVVEDVPVVDSPLSGKFMRVDDLFPVGVKVFLISNPFYGCEGIVQHPFDKTNSRFKVQVKVAAEPDFSRLVANQEHIGLFWYTGWQAAQKLSISPHLLSRITGTVYASDGTNDDSKSSGNRRNIGLNLKFSKRNEEVPDYTKRETDGVWMYSSKVLRILDEYNKKFPEIFDHLQGNDGGNDVFTAEELWKPDDSAKKLKELCDWLKSLPCYGLQHQATGTASVDERVIRVMETAVDKTKAMQVVEKKLVAVKPNALFRACLTEGNAAPDPQADYYLFDRVVCAREGYTVPVGLRGTVVGIHYGRQEGDLKLSVIFDEEFIGGVIIRNSRCSGYHIAASALINLSHGVRMAEEKRKAKEAAVIAQQQRIWRDQPAGAVDMARAGHRQPARSQQQAADMQYSYGVEGKRGEKQEGIRHHAYGPVRLPSGHATAPLGGVQQAALMAIKLPEQKSQKRRTPQGGKSIMNELFPHWATNETTGKKPGEITILNSSLKQDSNSLEESSRALRNLLNVNGKDGEARKQYAHGKSTTGADEDHRQAKNQGQVYGGEMLQEGGKRTPQNGPRVPYTARQPQPPPFMPCFDSPPVALPPQEQQQQPFQSGVSGYDQQMTMGAHAGPTTVMHPQPSVMHLQPNVMHPQPNMIPQPGPLPSPVDVASHQEAAAGQRHDPNLTYAGAVNQPTTMAWSQQFAQPPPFRQVPYNQVPFPSVNMPLPHQQLIEMQQQQRLQQLLAERQQMQLLHQQQQQQWEHYQQHLRHQQQQPGPQWQHQSRQYHQHARQNVPPGQQERHHMLPSPAVPGVYGQFVPMQVTKKQPAPAYVKVEVLPAKSDKEDTPKPVESRERSVPIANPAVATNESGAAVRECARASGPAVHSPSTSGHATRPKSRLAIKLEPQGPSN